MQTLQRHADPYLPPWTRTWSTQRRLGFGLLAILPLFLLMAVLTLVIATALGAPLEPNVPAWLFYNHVGVQFLVLLIFGHLMLGNARLTGRARLIWAALFLFAAPFSIPVYWAIHVWNPTPNMPDEQTPHTRLDRHVHVYDFDYTHSTYDRRTERRPDGAVVHHVDATI